MTRPETASPGDGDGSGADDTLLLFIHVPFRTAPDGGLLVEAQAANGLRLWAENFSRVLVMAPLDPTDDTGGWVDPAAIGPARDRIEFIPLHMAYRPDRFLRALPGTWRLIRRTIPRARWLCFSLGGLFGDWGAVASIAAARSGRRFAVWTDRVESAVTRRLARAATGKAALRARLTHRPMAALERHVIRRATLGLFHGNETFEAYAPLCRQSELVHNIHLSKDTHLTPEALRGKQARAAEGPLRILYAGRAEPMKGPDDWLTALAGLKAAGIAFEAEWIGGGSRVGAMQDRIADLGLGDRVIASGRQYDHAEVMARMRAAQLFVFCHLTPESPRCLIEALISGTPIVGYRGTYAASLIRDHGGGLLTPLGDPQALARAVAGLDADRGRLRALMAAALQDGAPFDDASVFRHRAELIRRYL